LKNFRIGWVDVDTGCGEHEVNLKKELKLRDNPRALRE